MLEIKNIKKGFKNQEVLKGINTDFKEGNVYGLLGNNGVGKTTLLKIIFNELDADGGEIVYNNIAQKDINYKDWYYFTETNDLPLDVSTYQFLKTNSLLMGLSDEEFKKRLNDAQEIIPINFKLKQKMKKLSSGQKKMVCCLSVLIAKPKVVFLDEPTANVDQENKEIIKDLIKALKSEDRIIVIITHLIEEIEDVLTNVVIIDDGVVKIDQPLKKKSASVIFDENIEQRDKTNENEILGDYLNE
ncbi:ATP-binding cassette domain-containing protein [Mesoplasma lactucae]|uniref:Uncharacterized protein n=1 Tax=Mesoplasma lactucae ATCC 49193 TaxID=81460 RepID=A0A291IS44_9MOLU|nr:ABC transporter ATP-binding protein [Mesoplasma lactucae]ATG97593.1 hypothetical protein CP520_02405 [Mesoplasma lactucae ATCC 49193]ATZ19947.1 ABC transporter ATP-binding protein [Mesoplasma lactucae ATCC 49193]MCL8217102.1 Vitamin B12 import ATP-binding protein BtuD [Mesoplasma lactucae ATCC 49193]